MTIRKVRPSGLVLLALAALLLAGCSARPFRSTPSPALQEELTRELAAGPDAAPWARPGARVVSICYSRALNTPEEVWQEAQLSCPTGTLTYRDSDVIWNRCALLQPAKANFICTPNGTKNAQN